MDTNKIEKPEEGSSQVERIVSPLALAVEGLIKRESKANYLLMEIFSWFEGNTYITETEFYEWAKRNYESYLTEG